MTTYTVWDGMDCGQNAKPTADIWRETRDDGIPPKWGYSLGDGVVTETLVLGFETEDDARAAAYAYVRECMADSACDVDEVPE